ncbi:hypothetical protein Prum_098560 [Phytohabitans rumicis]|uniref:Uncharacterized protein n=1 Tax=Phytohabitans rumicis TaxID=1076125 RepID=A0A6V8LJ26_9ACTN|nr:hypothetical protein [Phytohabitans rumicis]GFJ96214.1 hypothetical protein Prum_098560 [Phytohabitans rumicis]
MLDPAGYAVVAGVREPGDVADRHRVRQSFDAEVAVAEHAVGQVEAVAGEPFGVGLRADGLHHDVAGQRGAVVEDHLAGLEPVHGPSQVEPHAPALVAAQQGGGQRLAERADHRQRQRVDDGHLGAEVTGRGGHLAADEPGADDHQPYPRGERGAQPHSVVERAQHEPAGACALLAGSLRSRRPRLPAQFGLIAPRPALN